MKAAWRSTNEEDGPRMKQDDEKQLFVSLSLSSVRLFV